MVWAWFSHAAPAWGQTLPLPISLQVPLSAESAPPTYALVRAEAGLERIAREVAAQLPSALERIRSDLAPLPAPARIEVRLVRRAEDMSRVTPGGRSLPHWASGVAFPDAGVAIVATKRGPEPIDTVRVAEHELAHVVLGAALAGRAPRWLDEGFAYLHAADWSVERTNLLIGMAWTGDVIALGHLDQHFAINEHTAARAYAESYDLTAYLVNRGRYPDIHDDGDRWPFRRFLALIASGLTPDNAARRAYGAGLRELFGEWQEDLRKRYLIVPGGVFALGIWVVAALILVWGYIRRRRWARKTLARWEREEWERVRNAAAIKVERWHS